MVALPGNPQEIASILKKLEVKSLDDCSIHRIESQIAALEYALEGCELGEINELATEIRSHCGIDLVKYKAAYELECITDMESARRLVQHLDEYDFIPLPSTEEFGREILAKTGMNVALAEEYGFDFDAYGWSVLSESGCHSTSYGFISHARQQEQEMVMEPEPEQTMEQTMGM